MEVDIKTLMLLFFILFLMLSIWKIWAFLPNEQLIDDDKTQESEKKLMRLMLKVIEKKNTIQTVEELFLAMKKDKTFDSKLFWRFNSNRLKHLLNSYYINNPDTTSIKEISQKLALSL
ncbi:MAG: hypothetical protein COA39_006325 [Sulfurimonas sp.]|nr:hypothetical protein [Sulfurimonas sp.]